MSMHRDIVVNPQRSVMTMTSIIRQINALRQGRSTTLSSHGSPARSPAQKVIMRGLQGAVRDYRGLGSLSAVSLPAPVFQQERPSLDPLSSLSWLESGMHQMLEVITRMLETAFVRVVAWTY